MKGGMFALSETFLKIISTAFLAVVLLAIFFMINNYHLIYAENRLERETLVISNIVLSSCLAETRGGYPVKGLLSEEMILSYKDVRDENINCLKYQKPIYMHISDRNGILYNFGNQAACIDLTSSGECREDITSYPSEVPAALNTTSGEIIPVTVKVFLRDNYEDYEIPDDNEDPEPSPIPSTCSSETPNAIKHTIYPLGNCQYTNQKDPSIPLQWYQCQYRTPSGERTVCHENVCKEVSASIDYTNPSYMYARSDTITTSYKIKNTGVLTWCFYVEAGTTCQCTEGDSYSGSEYISLRPNEEYEGSFEYYVDCDVTVKNAYDQLTTPIDWWIWNSHIGVYADDNSYGWLLMGPNYQIGIVECLNDQDCVNCLGPGHTCNTAKYLCT